MSRGGAPLVLLVEDDLDSRLLTERWLTHEGIASHACENAAALVDALGTTVPDAVCLDLGLPDMPGLQVLDLLRQRHATIPCIVMSATRSTEDIVGAMQRGALDFVSKPAERTRFVTAVRHAIERQRLLTTVTRLQREVAGAGFGDLVGDSTVMQALYSTLERIAPSDITVLVTGETGTGKELVAQAIHANSARKAKPLIAVNCAAIPESLQDSELFGHERGAFTGAVATRFGHFERAQGGTLFLDEVGELSLGTQAKLLRVLQERKVERLGGSRSVAVDFRLVAATHRDLRAMVQDGSFREDLYFRLMVMDVQLPSLRERRGDIPLLVDALAIRIAAAQGIAAPRFSPDVMAALSGHDWRGNIRELNNVLQRAIVLSAGDEIVVGHLPRDINNEVSGAQKRPTAPTVAADAERAVLFTPAVASGRQSDHPDLLSRSLAEIERWAITASMARTNNNIAEVTRVLQIGRTTLYRKLKEYGVELQARPAAQD